MSFISFGSRYYNTDHIKSIRTIGKDQVVIDFIDGTIEDIKSSTSYASRILETLNDQVIPAQPGYMLLRYFGKDNADRLQIIGWSVDPGDIGGFGARPVTADGTPAENPQWAVLQPDGLVVQGGETVWNNYDEWLEEKNKEAVAAE